jgi:hypothetical protein
MRKISIPINGFYVFAQLLIMLMWLIGCSGNPVVDEPKDAESNTVSAVGKITMRQSGGIAGISRIITIREDNDAIILTSIERNQPKEVKVSQSEIENLWQKLETNEVFDLSTNQKLLERVADGFFYEVNVQKGRKQNQFSVYAPETLTENGEARYNAIVQAIETFTESKLNKNNPDKDEDFIIEDMKIEDISIQFLESFPLQVHVLVKGMFRNGCITLNEIIQKRDGNTVNIHITTKQPKDAVCIQMVKFITETIPLEGGFLPGKYKLIVNGIVKEFEIGGEIPGNGVLEGKVTIGPLCPVEPCNLTPEQIAKVYTSRKVIIYEQAAQKKVTETNLNENGEYSLTLKPGSYIIDISDSEGNALPLDIQRRPFMGNTAPKEAEVKAGEKVTVNFDIDTGIR